MEKEKVSRELAEQEMNSWLDAKKIFASRRENYKDAIETLIEAIQNGVLILEEGGQFRHKLLFPIQGEMAITELTYKPRLNKKMLETPLKGVKANDSQGRMLAYLQALTDAPKNILAVLDHEDDRIADSILIFFIS